MISFRKIWVIAKSLLLSQLRAAASRSGRVFNVRSIIRRPLILAIVDLVGFVVATGAAYYIGSSIESSGQPQLISLVASGVRSILVILPAVILTIVLVLGLVLEVSAGAQFASSDIVNWLPVRASEYVAASTLSLLIYYSVFPIVVLSATLSLAYIFGGLGAWELGAVLSLFGIVSATSILEIVRATLNRFSSSFYRRGGRTAIALRALSGVIIVILFQALFYPTVYEHFLGVITSSFGPTWLVPLLWASVAVTALLGGNLVVSTLFALLAVAFSSVLFFFAIVLRSKYWVPMPPSVRISSAVYAPKRGFASGVLNPPQLAIARKDLRGLVRRREMVRLLALPGVFLVVSFLGFSSSGGGFSISSYLGMFIVGYTTLFVAMSGIGAEGKSIMNLYQAPLSVKDFVVGKAVTAIVFGSLFGTAFYIIIGFIISRASVATAPLFLIASIGLAFEMSFVGLLMGIRFPNFSESPRASFVSQTAGLIALPTAVLIGGISLSPLLLTTVLNLSYQQIVLGFVGCLVILGVGSYVFYRLAFNQAVKLLSQIPVQ